VEDEKQKELQLCAQLDAALVQHRGSGAQVVRHPARGRGLRTNIFKSESVCVCLCVSVCVSVCVCLPEG
jgi:hypothetical protein